MWIEENEQIGRAFSGPGVPMLWSYGESDPFKAGPANLYDKLTRIVSGLNAIPQFDELVDVEMVASQDAMPTSKYDAIITDPPYGDNLFYSVLSEFIYVWKRMAFRDILPELFSAVRVPREKEIVAAHYGKSSFEDSMSFYAENLTKSLRNARMSLNIDGLLTLFFAHSTREAWEVIGRCLKDSGFRITAIWPMKVERTARPRGMRSNAVNVSFVIVARLGPQGGPVEWEVLADQIKLNVKPLSTELVALGWSAPDIGAACFGRAIGIAQASEVVEGGKVLPFHRSVERVLELVRADYPELIIQTRN